MAPFFMSKPCNSPSLSCSGGKYGYAPSGQLLFLQNVCSGFSVYADASLLAPNAAANASAAMRPLAPKIFRADPSFHVCVFNLLEFLAPHGWARDVE